MNITTLAIAAGVNGLVTGIAFYLIESRISGQSIYMKAGIASAVGTVGLGAIAGILNASS